MTPVTKLIFYTNNLNHDKLFALVVNLLSFADNNRDEEQYRALTCHCSLVEILMLSVTYLYARLLDQQHPLFIIHDVSSAGKDPKPTEAKLLIVVVKFFFKAVS